MIQSLYNLLSTTPESLSETEISQILDILPSLEWYLRTLHQHDLSRTLYYYAKENRLM